MCRIFNINLAPMHLKDLFFEKRENGYHPRSRAEILELLAERRRYALYVAEDCSMKNTKAGYDAGGITVGHKQLDSIIEEMSECRSGMTEEELSVALEQAMSYTLPATMTDTRVSRDGGDLLRTWPRLCEELKLRGTDFVTSIQTHIRQASQGDMYAKVNAHPHQEAFHSDTMTIYAMNVGEKKLNPLHRQLSWGRSLFADSHNGDINDANAYRVFLTDEGFTFLSNSDSCIEPALKRWLYEHLQSGHLVGALHKLAYTDPHLIGTETLTVKSGNRLGVQDYQLSDQNDLSGKTASIRLENSLVTFIIDDREYGPFKQKGFLRDDTFSTVGHKILNIDRMAHRLQDRGAKKVTIAAGVVARVLEYSNPSSKFVFQSFSSVGKARIGFIGGGTYTLLRGGSREGGEEGGEAVFYIPHEFDEANYGKAVLLTGSEENSFKERVAILDAGDYLKGMYTLATERTIEVTHLPSIRAKAHIIEGVVPVYDIHPGEILEVNSDGCISLFDIYSGRKIALADHEGHPIDPKEIPEEEGLLRRQRLAPLKVFRIAYTDLEGNPIPCPFNKYGEEIMVIQPMALRDNRDKLFYRDGEGRVRLRLGNSGLGLTMSSDNEEVRRLVIRSLKHKIIAAAGTSFMISQTAAFMSRKLGLHTLPTLVLEGFTGADTSPSYINRDTLLIANSNTGGTSDTVKFVQQLTNLQAVLGRAQLEMDRRDPTRRDVGGTLALIREIKKHLHAGKRIEDLQADMLRFLHDWVPWVYVITNIEASYLGGMGKGQDRAILRPAGTGVTNLPEEECVGSTFAALASLQWQLALDTYIGEVREDISSDYAASVYEELYQVPEVIERITGDQRLIENIRSFSNDLVGGNFDFIYTGFVDGVFDEQAHKAAEMIQEMFVGWQFFMFQHGKYAHIKRQTRYQVGSIVGHNAPPPAWPFFNERARKSPREIGPRSAVTFMLAHSSDANELRDQSSYPVDYLFTYPEDSVVLYPFQAIVIGQLISYLWGLEKGKIGRLVTLWNQPFVDLLTSLPQAAAGLSDEQLEAVTTHAEEVLRQFTTKSGESQCFDNISTRRKDFIVQSLCLLSAKKCSISTILEYENSLRGVSFTIPFTMQGKSRRKLTGAQYLTVLKQLALELSSADQAKALADHFLLDPETKAVSEQRHTITKSNGTVRDYLEYDYWCEYEGLGTFFNVDPVHPPKVAKAKKGWL
ncbi:hypothetical protein JW905_00945 [bacterium]|nr:hypothetical protein [candidate division CSSED10-310 bacterium]